MSGLSLTVAPELTGRARLGVLALEGVTVHEADPGLATEVDALCAELRARHAGVPSGSVPGVEEARGLYKALGIDPTKTRPSNEALLRRALKGEALYRINTLVDALNLASLRSQVPFGLYDLAKLEPPLTLRRGGPGESYEGIRKGPVGVEGRPVLVDARGPFGNPTSDSARTCIGLGTTRALVVAYAPATCPDRRLSEVLDATEALLVRWCGGTRGSRFFVP
ncbi:MAG TPA: phenylalanine--tRNA ligase beta subunit-related protein [Vicinamibacteria bacterium]|nr:phenylalanine--tRNA ligase beta subunit-related protein [Vicinamibacteria bacterium]